MNKGRGMKPNVWEALKNLPKPAQKIIHVSKEYFITNEDSPEGSEHKYKKGDILPSKGSTYRKPKAKLST